MRRYQSLARGKFLPSSPALPGNYMPSFVRVGSSPLFAASLEAEVAELLAMEPSDAERRGVAIAKDSCHLPDCA